MVQIYKRSSYREFSIPSPLIRRPFYDLLSQYLPSMSQTLFELDNWKVQPFSNELTLSEVVASLDTDSPLVEVTMLPKQTSKACVRVTLIYILYLLT